MVAAEVGLHHHAWMRCEKGKEIGHPCGCRCGCGFVCERRAGLERMYREHEEVFPIR